MQSYIGGGHIAFGADPVVVPIPDHMASLLFYRSFIGMVAVIATRQPNKQSILLLDHVVKLIIML